LIDQLVAYNHVVTDHHYYTTRFIDGLKDDTKAAVLVQRLVNLVTACTLALMWEKTEAHRCKEFRRGELLFRPKFPMGASPLPLPPPPTMVDNVHVTNGPADKSEVDNSSPALADNKVVVLHAYRRAHELCQYCVEK
jgi:hypothetical protein